jgi:hypothetical protein
MWSSDVWNQIKELHILSQAKGFAETIFSMCWERVRTSRMDAGGLPCKKLWTKKFVRIRSLCDPVNSSRLCICYINLIWIQYDSITRSDKGNLSDRIALDMTLAVGLESYSWKFESSFQAVKKDGKCIDGRNTEFKLAMNIMEQS